MSKKIKEPDVFVLLGRKFRIPLLREGEINVKSIVDVRKREIEEQLKELPYYLESFGALQAKAMKRANLLETKYKIWRAHTDAKVRSNFDSMKGDKGKEYKYTEKMVEAKIVTNPKYLVWKKRIYRAQEQLEQVKVIYWALQNKSTVLLELSKKKSSLDALNKL